MANQVKIYHSQLRPDSIINLDQPCHYEDFHELPGYLYNTVETFDQINERYLYYIDILTGHWSRLLEHIEKWGIIYPIVVNTGLPKNRALSSIPLSYRATPSKFWTVCEDQGGLRILAAKKLGLRLPAIVNDHTGMYNNKAQITMRELASRTEGIKQIYLSPRTGLKIGEFPRIHLDISDEEYLHCKHEAVQLTISEYKSWGSTLLLQERINTLQRIEYDHITTTS
jgi:hypothetical protein